MVDYNLINSLGDIDADVDLAVTSALGEAAGDMNKLVGVSDIQDLASNKIIKGRISGHAGDDFVVELGLKSEGVLEAGAPFSSTVSK